MVRRRPPEPDAGRRVVPERLRRFEPEDWVDLWEYLPDWWELDKDGSVAWFRYLRARCRYEDAVRAWQDEHGVGFYEWDVVRGACGPGCAAAAYEHTHGG